MYKIKNYEKDEVTHSQHFIFFITYEWLNKLDCYITLGWKDLTVANTLAYWAYLKGIKKMKCCEYGLTFPKLHLLHNL